MARVYGLTIEPGGMDLGDEHAPCKCPKCGEHAIFRTWEDCRGGSINRYSYTLCAFGHFEGDDPANLYEQTA